MTIHADDDLNLDYYLSTSLTEARDAARKLSAVSKRTDDQETALADAVEETVRLTNAREALAITVRSEPTVYGPGSEHSYFVDRLATAPGSAALVPNVPPLAAKARLERSDTEMSYINQRKDAERRKAWNRLSIRAGDLDATVSSEGGVFVSPQFITDRFSTVARAAGTVRSLIETVPAPPYGLEITIPRFASAGPITSPSAENQVEDAGYGTTSEVTHPVSSFWGTVSISLQLLQRGAGVDAYLAEDMAGQFVADSELQIIDGNGSSQDFLGLLNVSGIASQVFTAVDPTPDAFFVGLGQLVGQVARARKRPPNAIVLNTSRFVWAMSQTDGEGVPYMRPGVGTALASDVGAVATLWGVPVYLSEAMPVDLGGSDNEDTALVLYKNDLLLLESDPIFDVQVEGGSANQMTAFARFRVYSSFFPDRFGGASTGAMTGTGMVVQEGYGA
jgi:HK97 family phage major capsid protein